MQDSEISKALEEAIRYYGMKVNAFLQSGKYPSGQDTYRKNYKPIQQTMNISSVESMDTGYSQTIRYGGKNAPYATAYEFGTPEYTISAKSVPMAVGKATILRTGKGWKPVNRKGVLASKKFRGSFMMDEEEVFLFSSVTHPAFSARPFASRVLTQEQNDIVKKVGQEIFARVVLDVEKL